VPYREFIRLRLLAVLVLFPLLLAVGTAMDGGSGWGWWLAGAVGWLALCGLVLYRVYHREESGVGRQVQPSPCLEPSGERILATAGTGTRNPHEVVEGSVCRTNEAAPAAQARAAHIVGSLSVTSARSCCPATSCHDVSSRLS
jgi:hypothetical protein